jgi:uncharacterized protein (TIGR03086 family)
MPLLTDLVGSLDDDQLDLPTPCADFTVRNILEHMVGGATMFAAAFRGDRSPDSTPQDVVAAFPAAMEQLRVAVRSPGALDRSIEAPFGAVSGDTFARFVALDGLVHGWDISTATARRYAPPADLVAEVDAFAHQAISNDMRNVNVFADEVDAPYDASPLLRLIAFTGRRA